MIYDRQLSSLQLAIAVVNRSGPWWCLAGFERRRSALWLEVGRLASLGVIAAFALRHAPGLDPCCPRWHSSLLGFSLLGLSALPLAACPSLRERSRSPQQARWDAGFAVTIMSALVLYAGYKHRVHMLGRPAIRLPCLQRWRRRWSVFHSRRMVSSGLVFAIGFGLPMWIILVISEGTTNLLSVILHLVPPLAAALYVRRHGLSRGLAVGVAVVCRALAHQLPRDRPGAEHQLGASPLARDGLLRAHAWGNLNLWQRRRGFAYPGRLRAGAHVGDLRAVSPRPRPAVARTLQGALSPAGWGVVALDAEAHAVVRWSNDNAEQAIPQREHIREVAASIARRPRVMATMHARRVDEPGQHAPRRQLTSSTLACCQ